MLQDARFGVNHTVIVVDDGSSDSTRTVLASYGRRILMITQAIKDLIHTAVS